jgi:hypothetical protein
LSVVSKNTIGPHNDSQHRLTGVPSTRTPSAVGFRDDDLRIVSYYEKKTKIRRKVLAS